MERVSTSPRRRKALLWFLAVCVAWIVAVAVWAAVSLLAPAREGAEEAVERKAGMHHDQHHPEMRFYVPTYAKTGKDGAAVLRYEVGDSIDSSVADFLRTYDVTAEPKRTGPSGETYTDRFGDVRRVFTVAYDRSPDPLDTYGSPAHITVRATPLHTAKTDQQISLRNR
ncbi:hypothetical protein [Streptomyces beijiangensis]|uniref:Uncharacterized protein n=1 Tax=Streptomyces beijiangensis TaxID=163361 RepID=A0A939FBL2_9ACTN|nr:hypothetical protein [Streptomyces beijiangensis]MBO0515279.1 hypothetical protein [Streptomyces beijiangensis]